MIRTSDQWSRLGSGMRTKPIDHDQDSVTWTRTQGSGLGTSYWNEWPGPGFHDRDWGQGSGLWFSYQDKAQYSGPRFTTQDQCLARVFTEAKCLEVRSRDQANDLVLGLKRPQILVEVSQCSSWLQLHTVMSRTLDSGHPVSALPNAATFYTISNSLAWHHHTISDPPPNPLLTFVFESKKLCFCTSLLLSKVWESGGKLSHQS